MALHGPWSKRRSSYLTRRTFSTSNINDIDLYEGSWFESNGRSRLIRQSKLKAPVGNGLMLIVNMATVGRIFRSPERMAQQSASRRPRQEAGKGWTEDWMEIKRQSPEHGSSYLPRMHRVSIKFPRTGRGLWRMWRIARWHDITLHGWFSKEDVINSVLSLWNQMTVGLL